MKKGSDFEGFAMSESYSDKANQDVVLKVTQAVFEDNGGQDKCPWSNAQLKAAGATYFKTRKDAHAREQKDATNKHNLTCRRQRRIRDKVQKRLDTLEKMTCESERRAEIQAVLIPSYTSSDESDFSEDENGEPSRLKEYLVKKLPWERASLRKVKAKLDNKYLESLSARSRRNILPRRNHSTPSARPVPPNAPQWAVRPLTNTPVATSTPIRSR